MKFNRPLIFLDLEMTGPDPFNKNHVIYEIAALRVDPVNLGILDTFNYFCGGYPSFKVVDILNSVPQAVQEKVGIKKEHLIFGKETEHVLEEFKAWLPQEYIFVGYNLILDFAFLKREKKDLRIDRFVDLSGVYELHRSGTKKNTERHSISLTDIASQYGVDTSGAHSALKDVEICRQVFITLVKNSKT